MDQVPMCLVFIWNAVTRQHDFKEIIEDDYAITTAKKQGWTVLWRSTWLTPSPTPDPLYGQTQPESD